MKRPGDMKIQMAHARFRAPLYKLLKAAARKNGVSLNAEIVARLQRSFEADRLQALEKQLADLSALLQKAPAA